MPQEPTVHEPTVKDHLASIRRLLDEAFAKFEQDIKEVESQFAGRGQTGVLIRKTLDLGKQHVDRNVNSTFREMHWVLSRTNIDRREMTEPTIRELTSFLSRTKKTMLGSFKRRVRGGVGAVRMIDQEMQALDRSLQHKIEQMEGLLKLVEPAKPPTGQGRATPEAVSERVRAESLFSAFFSEPVPGDVEAPSARETDKAPHAAGTREPTAGSSSNRSIRERAAEAQLLAQALRQSVVEEMERIKADRRNERGAAPTIDYLTNVAGTLDQIAAALGGAKRATTAEQKNQNFEQAETLASSLAKAARKFAEDQTIGNLPGGGNTISILLSTALFTTSFGVALDLASDVQSALLNMPVKTRATN